MSDTIKSSESYVRILVSLIMLGYICRYKKNTQHSIFLIPLKIYFYQEVRIKIDCLPICFQFNDHGFPKVISNIKCYICIMKTIFIYKRDLNNILPAAMLEYLVTYNSS